MDKSQLAQKMLEWEKLKMALNVLEEEIKAEVQDLGKTQTVGNVRASYSGGRKTYDNQEAAKGLSYHELKDFEQTTVNWKLACEAYSITDIPFTQSSPRVTVKLLSPIPLAIRQGFTPAGRPSRWPAGRGEIEMIILINAGQNLLSNPEMRELEKRANASTWNQLAVPEMSSEDNEVLADLIFSTISDFVTVKKQKVK